MSFPQCIEDGHDRAKHHRKPARTHCPIRHAKEAAGEKNRPRHPLSVESRASTLERSARTFISRRQSNKVPFLVLRHLPNPSASGHISRPHISDACMLPSLQTTFNTFVLKKIECAAFGSTSLL
jgi:hypothetical protein